MESLQVLVRDAARSVQGFVSLPWAETMLAALAADPETLDEFDRALQRFQLDTPLDAWRREFEASDADLADAPRALVVDLPRRLIFARGLPFDWEGSLEGGIFQDGQPLEFAINERLPAAWRASDSLDGWREQVETAAREQTLVAPFDSRRVLYDEAPAWLASALVAARADGKSQPEVDIHVAWLTTPREDLGGRTPREILIDQIDFIDEQMDRRRAEWNALGRPASGLPRGSRAYREGGVGLHEFIVYYDLIRTLLWQGWERLSEQPSGAEELAAWMRDEQRRWLDQRVDDGGPGIIVPDDVIECERRRIPYTDSPAPTRVDDDSPPRSTPSDPRRGPSYIHFTTSHIDVAFVFSPYKDRKAWEWDYGEPTDEREPLAGEPR